MGEQDVLATKLDSMSQRMGSIENTMNKLADAMVQVARLEVQMAGTGQSLNRAFDSIEKMSESLSTHSHIMDERIKKLEESAPVAKLVNGWVLAWIAGVVGLVGGAVAMKVLGI
jgi:chromosome segregation ATPase